MLIKDYANAPDAVFWLKATFSFPSPVLIFSWSQRKREENWEEGCNSSTRGKCWKGYSEMRYHDFLGLQIIIKTGESTNVYTGTDLVVKLWVDKCFSRQASNADELAHFFNCFC